MILDIFVGAVLLISAIISFIRGLIREVLTIFGVVGGLLASYFFGGNASTLIEDAIRPEQTEFEFQQEPEKLFDLIPYDLAADVMAYTLVFIVVVGILSVISHFSAETLKRMGLGALDRTLGVIFGLLRGVLFLGLIYLPFYMLLDSETKNKWFEGARTYFYLEKTSEIIASFFPAQMEGTDTEEDVEKVEDDEFGTRQILRNLEVLKEEADAGLATFATQPPADSQGQPSAAPQEGLGYSEEMRNGIDALIEKSDQLGDQVIDVIQTIETQPVEQESVNQ